MESPRILVAGVGNIFLGDDAFGVEVARRLARRCWSDEVCVVDFGIRGLDLAYALLYGGYDAVILIDAAPRGAAPGTLYVIEPDAENTDGERRDVSPPVQGALYRRTHVAPLTPCFLSLSPQRAPR